MKNKCLISIFTLAVICALVACSDNLFGSGSTSSGSTDIKSLRIDAENAFRNGKYDDAYKICSRIVEIDSTVSFGYFGMAQAELWKREIHNPAEIFDYIDVDDNEIPFMGINAKIQNKYLQGMKEVARVYAFLDRRDSLTRLYEFHKEDSLSWATTGIGLNKFIDEQSLEARLGNFRSVFCNNSKTGACVDTIVSKSFPSGQPFPLSDREYKGDYFGGVLLIATIAKSLLNVFDINGDGCIARRGVPGEDNPGEQTDIEAWKSWNCNSTSYDLSINLKFDEDGNFVFDLDQILEDLGLTPEFYQSRIDDKDTPLPDEVSGLNDKIDNFTGDLDEVIDMMDALGLSGSDEDPAQWKEDIETYKAYAGFYRIGTRIDEDGDGCIEEDLLDGQDNDGDGLKNANARVASTDSTNKLLWGKSGINHGMYGEVDEVEKKDINGKYVNDARNYPVLLPAPVYIANQPGVDCKETHWLCTELWGNEENGMVTVIGFTQEPGYWTSNDLDLKLAVAQDTVCGQLKYSLQDRKDLIGGCWPNYDNEKFLKYWLRRGLASPEEQVRRTHPSCNSCVTTENCTKKGN